MHRRSGLVTVLVLGLAARAQALPSQAQLCESAMAVASGKFAQCRLAADSAFARTGNTTRLNTSLGRCSSTLSKAFMNAQNRYGANCPALEPETKFDSFLMECTDTTFDAATGGTFPHCGDGSINAAGEQCDGSDLGGETCASLGFLGGTLACDASCQFDTSGCRVCEAGALLSTGETTCWDDSGNVIACAGTGQDGDTLKGVPLAYVDNGDGTITDATPVSRGRSKAMGMAASTT